MRGIFFSEDDARTVEGLLAADGYDVALSRVRYAGEDDDEDHPWAVSTDAPGLVLEVLVDRYEGWLDDDDDQKPSPAPLDLPAAPKRHHQPPA
ncbi:hypothetical protein [Nocardioides marmorisolisilvae]|uniref:Uncharacterized protein n=1 Tax=Nocardioides marmorisolisilvae TaxID=1542737 RepID=A0A3N0DVV7_9ACTN|nr:hypothetical protein [Nocardioides marmorisolisilvae]RNL79745.1 hypothetical protein EFL95_12370 [Nocardioides marmorisolisilvae]